MKYQRLLQPARLIGAPKLGEVGIWIGSSQLIEPLQIGPPFGQVHLVG